MPGSGITIYYPTGDWSPWSVADEFGTPITETGSAADLGDFSNGTYVNLPAFSESLVGGVMHPIWDNGVDRYIGKSATVWKNGVWRLNVIAKASATQPGPVTVTIGLWDKHGNTFDTIEESFAVEATTFTTYTATGSVTSWPDIARARSFNCSIASSTFEDIQVSHINFTIPVLVYPLNERDSWAESGVMMIE